MLVESLCRRRKIYAVIETGGKQYRVSPGQVIEVERLNVPKGDTLELDKVLLIADADKVTVGTPTVDGAKVLATSQGEAKNDKIIVFRYKSKVRSRRKTGHRQLHARLAIDQIVLPGAAPSKPARKPRTRKGEGEKDGA